MDYRRPSQVVSVAYYSVRRLVAEFMEDFRRTLRMRYRCVPSTPGFLRSKIAIRSAKRIPQDISGFKDLDRNIRNSFGFYLVFSIFTAITLAQPYVATQEQLNSKVQDTDVDKVSSTGFIEIPLIESFVSPQQFTIAAAIVLLGMTLHLHVLWYSYLRCNNRDENHRMPFFFNLPGILPVLISFSLLYLSPPLMMFFLAAKSPSYTVMLVLDLAALLLIVLFIALFIRRLKFKFRPIFLFPLLWLFSYSASELGLRVFPILYNQGIEAVLHQPTLITRAMTGASFTNQRIQEGKIFRNSNLMKNKYLGGEFRENIFFDASLRETIFDQTVFNNVSILGASDTTNALIMRGQLDKFSAPNSELNDVVLLGNYGKGVDFSRSNIQRSYFQSNLFVDSLFYNATFSSTRILEDAESQRLSRIPKQLRLAPNELNRGSKFVFSDFSGASFESSIIRETKFLGSDLTQVNFREAQLGSGIELSDSCLNGTLFPSDDALRMFLHWPDLSKQCYPELGVESSVNERAQTFCNDVDPELFPRKVVEVCTLIGNNFPPNPDLEDAFSEMQSTLNSLDFVLPINDLPQHLFKPRILLNIAAKRSLDQAQYSSPAMVLAIYPGEGVTNTSPGVVTRIENLDSKRDGLTKIVIGHSQGYVSEYTMLGTPNVAEGQILEGKTTIAELQFVDESAIACLEFEILSPAFKGVSGDANGWLRGIDPVRYFFAEDDVASFSFLGESRDASLANCGLRKKTNIGKRELNSWVSYEIQGQQILPEFTQRILADFIEVESTGIGEEIQDTFSLANVPAPNFVFPVSGKIISVYSSNSSGVRNDGINVSAPFGSDVSSAAAGEVVYRGSELDGYGNLLLIKHQSGWVTAYAHLANMKVRKGDKVKAGQKIGTVGTTGAVARNNPQLHFELRLDLKSIDPAIIYTEMNLILGNSVSTMSK